MAAIGAATLVAYPARWRQLALAGLAVAAAVAPVLWWSHAVTGSATGVLELSVKMGRREYPGQGLWYYLTHWPTAVAGPVMGVIALCGLGAGLAAWRRRAPRPGLADADDDPATVAARAHAGRQARRLLVVAALGLSGTSVRMAAEALLAAHGEQELLAEVERLALAAVHKAGGADALVVPVPLARGDVHDIGRLIELGRTITAPPG